MNIYINNIAKWRVDKYTFSDNQLDVRSISMTVTHPSNWIGENAPAVADFTDAYILYKGERFELTVSSPTAEKNTNSIDYKYELIFKGVEEELSRRKVRDLAKIGESNFVAQGTSFILSGDAQQFKQLIENNLKYYFNGDWTISLLENPGNDLYSFAKIAVDNMSIWELLGKTYEYYGLRWRIKNKEIIIGYTPDIVEHIFDYGKDGGLVKITRTKQDENTINRLIAVGSSRNIPLNYFTDRYDKFPKDPNPISSVVNIRNLMPKVFRDSVKAGAPPYIDYVEDSVLVAKDGVRESIESPNEDIYPSISKVEVAGIGRIDQIVASEIPTTDSSSDNGYSQTFDIWIKDIGFDLIDDKYTSTQDAKISFTSGELAGYEFTILATGGVRHVSEDTSKSHNGVQSKYRITLIKSDEDYDATGRMLPNTVLYPKVHADGSADSFVIYDIEMPQVYVELAEERLEAWMNERLDKLKIEKPTYAIEIMDSFFATATIESDNKKIEDKIIAGNKVKINNTNVTNGVQELFISNVKVDYKGILPKYFITITDKLGEDRGVISRIENTINKVSNNQQVDKQEIKSNLHTHANKMVLDLFKEDSQGNVYLDRNFYSTRNISAFGFEEEQGGGVIINVIDSLTSTSKTDPLSANQGRYLKTLIDNIEVGEGGQVIVDWEAITGKPSTFTPSAHTHIIGNVTGLQGALDGKASLTQLDDKEDKFTKNSAFNKNFGTGLNDVARGNHTHAFASLTSIPTTLSGYGITDGANKVHTHPISDVANLQTELNKKATNTALTTHVNETDNPHSVTKKQVGLEFVANKDLSNVDNIQQATKTEFTSHKNLFDSMFRKVGANIEAKLSLYSLGGLSAYGFSEEGSEGGGGIVNILPSWANYTTDKSGWALSAGLGVDLNTRKADKTWVESLLEDYVPTDTTYTAGRGLTLTGTVFSTSFDIANYATVTALAGKVNKVAGKSLISDVEITRLAGVTNQTRASLNITNVDNTSDANKPISSATQTALNSKLATSIFNTHNNDNIRHITGAERTKWNGVVTDFGNLEIGGRNLIINTSSIEVKATTNTENTSPSERIYISNNFNFKANQSYTISLDLKAEEGLTILNYNFLLGTDGLGNTRVEDVLIVDNNEWGRYSLTVKFDVDRIGRLVLAADSRSSGVGKGLDYYGRYFKLEKGTIPTDWTPAPEDQVSDWNTTDVNSFSFIKNKPTLLSQFTDNIGVAQHRIDFDSFKTTFDTMFRKTSTNEIEAKLSLYTLGGLSAYGFSDEGSSGGGGGIVNILSDWAIYDASKSGWALGAGLGKGLYDDKADKTDPRFTDARTPLAHSHVISDVTGLQTALNAKTNQTFSDGLNTRLTSIEGGSATTVNVSGTGDLLASVSKVGNNINFIKGNQSWGNLSGKPSVFAPSAHSHPISDITGLQIALNSKLETSIFNTHNNDNVRHITGAERTKWDTVVTDFAGLEIGGRNLLPAFTSDKWKKSISVEPYRFTPRINLNDEISIELELIRGYEYTLTFNSDGMRCFVYTFDEFGERRGLVLGQYDRVFTFTVPNDSEYVSIAFNTSTSNMSLERSTWNPKLEKGNKATDWSPAPEDQVSDWNTTDVNSFSFIKNKPTLLSQFTDDIGVATHIANKTNPHSVTKSQVGLGNVANKDLSNVDNIQQATKTEFTSHKNLFDSMFRKVGINIEAKLSLYSLGGLSAYGFSEEGSETGGGIVNILPSWESYDTSKSGWALSAGLGENLRTRVTTLENAEIDLSGYATLNYINDKVKTNVPLNAKFTDTIVDISGKVDKKSGFSLVADTEITRLSSVTNQDLSSYAKTSDVNTLLLNKVDKVTGKSLISDTEITRLSSVTNQDLTPYALKTYVDTEVGKKWTYNETTIKAVKVSNAVRADNVGGFTVGVNVPANAKFTDTIVDISGKVDKVVGKSLISDSEITRLSSVTNQDISGKVDKVAGKGLSTNDFTTVEKNKLATLENQTRASLGVDNVTNESKSTMFTNPTFTGTTKVTILELNSNWKFVKVGNNIELQFDGVTKQIMTDNGDIIATAGVTAYQ